MSILAPTPFPVVVIGGGISGLACAHRLQQSGIPVKVFDPEIRPGGVIATKEKEGFRFELGPQSFLSTSHLLELIDALGLKDQLLRANPAAPRYILHKGHLVPAPLAPPSLLTTPLLGAVTKWRIFSEIFHRTSPPSDDESVASFIRRKFGNELLDKMVAPFVSGVYAGDPERLSLPASFPALHEFESKYGSVIRGAIRSRPRKGAPRAELCTFRDGMETLPKALGMRLAGSLVTETRVLSLRRGKLNGKPWFEIEVMRGDHREVLSASSVVMAAPTYAASQILKELSEPIARTLERIEYAPIVVIAAGYRLDQIRQAGNGFGFLIPRTEGLRVLGTVWNSSLFAGRAPEGMACFTSFAGGATDSGICDLKDDEIARIISSEVEAVLGISGKPVTTIFHRYAQAIPQYNLGHGKIVSTLQMLTASIPGIFLAGNYLAGPSIGACVEQANQTANAVRVYLTSMGLAGAGAVAHA